MHTIARTTLLALLGFLSLVAGCARGGGALEGASGTASAASQLSAGDTIQAEALTSSSSPNPHLENNGATLGFFDVGTWFCYANVDLTGVSALDLRMASANTGGVFTVRVDGSTGAEIARYTVATATGGWNTWETRPVAITATTGVHTLCLRGEAGYGILNLDWLKPDTATASVQHRAGDTIQAEALTSSSSPNPHLENNGTTLGFFDVGTWFCYANVDLTGVSGLDLRMAAANTGGVFTVRVDGNGGTEIARYTVSTPTGGWSTWEARTVPIAATLGVHQLCLQGEANYGILNLDWLKLDPGSDDSGDDDTDTDTTYTLPYHRIRIEFLDQGDWETLTIGDPSRVIKVRQMSLEGTPNVLSVEKTGLGLNTNFGSDLKVVADYAIDPSAANQPFQMTLTKGGAGTATIRVYTVVDGAPHLVKEVLKRASQPYSFSVDLSSLKSVAPIQAPLAPVKPMGLALYYPWYSLSNWTNPVLKDHPQTPYASNDPTAIDRQMDQAKSAGITAFTVSWVGPGSESDNNFKIMLNEAAKKGFYLGFFLETTGGDLPNNTQRAIDWLTYISRTYSSHPNVLKVAGKPVVTPWLTSLITPQTWATIHAAVRANGQDVWLLSDKQETEYIDVMDGVRYSGGIAGLGEKVRLYSVLADNPAPKLWMATAMPGFDERNLSDRGPNPRYIDRANGDYFRGQLNDVFNNSPQWVVIDTWNEWYENTYIEPSQNYGDQYLQIAGSYLNGWVQK